MKTLIQWCILCAVISPLVVSAQSVTITVDATKGLLPISPYIYGKNGNLSNDPTSPITDAQWTVLRESGLRFTRENDGNNATKYNWRLKLTSHPDWYNNVYACDWDYAAKSLGDNLPGTQGMWGFQFIGKAASNAQNNFNDFAYNGSIDWSGVLQNLAGGGTPDPKGGDKALVEGDPSKYLMDWPADSSVAILDHWFGVDGLGFDKSRMVYWSMDNEPDIWFQTHDDVATTQPDPDTFIAHYVDVAKKARAMYPGIKLTGPVPASEWNWYAWNEKVINKGGQNYVWLEYFIKRIAEEETASGVRLLDVLDIHNYPNETTAADIVQLHRMYFDSTYVYPGANGVKLTGANGFDNSITTENIFGRCTKWLNQYMGPNHGVTFGVSEYGINNVNENVTSVSYASTLGTFADHGVEFFSPWDWFPGMWETLHLFSRYGKSTRVESISDDDKTVSAYSSISSAGDSVTVILVNRSVSASENATVNLSNYAVAPGSSMTLQLAGLPEGETFVSHTNNALAVGTAQVADSSFTIELPRLSTTAVLLTKAKNTGVVDRTPVTASTILYPNPVTENTAFVNIPSENISGLHVEVHNMLGEIVFEKSFSDNASATIAIPCATFSTGVYIVNFSTGNGAKWSTRLLKM